MQKIGLEWMWRIKEDPALWRRYAFDGFALMSLLVTKVIPNTWYIFLHKPSLKERGSTIEITDDGDEIRIRLGGVWVQENLGPLREFFSSHSRAARDVRLDFKNITYVDSAFIGLVLLWHGDRIRQGKRMLVSNLNQIVQQSFRYACAEYVLNS
jgi:N-acetylglucosaminyldiphosphoundecaprenol N-acetyl-beta-D-mannosaminyltransferase